VVRDVAEDQLQPPAVRLVRERVEVGERAEQPVAVAVVGHVVAEVGHRRAVERREPDRLDAEPLQVRQAGADAGEVADPSPSESWNERGVDLVDRAATEPVGHA
jgi:hypothetical protein